MVEKAQNMEESFPQWATSKLKCSTKKPNQQISIWGPLLSLNLSNSSDITFSNIMCIFSGNHQDVFEFHVIFSGVLCSLTKSSQRSCFLRDFPFRHQSDLQPTHHPLAYRSNPEKWTTQLYPDFTLSENLVSKRLKIWLNQSDGVIQLAPISEGQSFVS